MRYGKVHSYNNLFVGDRTAAKYAFMYAIGLAKMPRC